jgi:MOSC domain-containing protein YiiM
MLAVDSLTLVVGKGIQEDRRYFGRVRRSSGQPSRRQLSLIEREQLAEHAAVLGLLTMVPGAARANIETTGIDLGSLLGQEVELGEAVVLFYAARQPCHKMDAVCAGLRKLMENGRQGVLAEVVRAGRVRLGDSLRPASFRARGRAGDGSGRILALPPRSGRGI